MAIVFEKWNDADHEALAEIELVRLLALRAGIEREDVAAPLAGHALHVGDHGRAGALRAHGLVGHEIVAVELAPREGLLDDAEDGDAGDPAGVHRHRHLGAAREHLLHAAAIVGRQLRAKLAVHGLGGGEERGVRDRGPARR